MEPYANTLKVTNTTRNLLPQLLTRFLSMIAQGEREDFEKALILYRKLKVRFLEGTFHLRKRCTNNSKLHHILNDNESQFQNNDLDIRTYHNHDLCYDNTNIAEHNRKVNNIINHFWEKLRREYLVNLRETHRNQMKQISKSPTITENDTVLIDDKTPHSQWKLAKVIVTLKGTR